MHEQDRALSARVRRALAHRLESGPPDLMSVARELGIPFRPEPPTEADADIIAIADLTVKIRQVWEEIGKQRGRLGRLHLSVNPFVPKPWTPLQWAPMERRTLLEKKYRLLQKRLRPLPNVGLNFESLRRAEIQGFFARGDRRVSRTLPLLAEGASLKAACRQVGLDPAFYLHRERGVDELFPWDIIEQGVQREHLREEYDQALAAQLGYICHPGCRRCGLVCYCFRQSVGLSELRRKAEF